MKFLLTILITMLLFGVNIHAEEKFSIDVIENMVQITNHSVYANCCSKFTSEHHIDGNKIIITQRDTSAERCRCNCNFDLLHYVEQIKAGKYKLEIYRDEKIRYGYNENRTFLVYKGEFEITGEQSKSPLSFSFKQSVCLEEFTSFEDIIDLGDKIEVIPNPGFGSVDLRFSVMQDSDVDIKILNILGKEILKLNRTGLTAGTYTMSLNAVTLQPGMYIGKFTTTYGRTSSFKLIWSK